MRIPVALAAAALLTGCSGGDPQAAPVPPPPSPSASPAYSPAPLPSPRATGLDGEVERAVLAYFRGINRLLATGDPTEFDASYTPECTSCAAFSRQVAGDYDKGLRSTAVDEVLSLEVAGGNSPNAGAATVAYRVPPYRITRADGSLQGEYPESRATRIFTVVRVGGAFKVVSLQDVAS